MKLREKNSQLRYPFSQLIQVPSVSVSDVREAMEVDAPVEGGVSSKTFKWLLMPTGAILAKEDS